MSLADIDAQKARAIDLFHRGELDESDALYKSLADEYSRHGVDDALLGIVFNRLLLALETGHRAQISALMSQLVERFESARHQTPILLEVAKRITRLFHDPFPGVDHAATAALVELAARWSPTDGGVDGPPLDIEGLPGPTAFVGIDAGDAAVMILSLAYGVRRRIGVPDWLRAVSDAFGDPTQERQWSERANGGIAALMEGNIAQAYQSLTDAFSLALSARPAVAAELSVGLSILEEDGLPERLAFAPSLPEERRLERAVELHGKLALALSEVAGAERLAVTQWAHVRALASAWAERVATRGQRGGGRGGDASREALLAVWQSRSLRALGDLDGAAQCLEAPVRLAERAAFDTLTTACAVLYEAAETAERQGLPDRAIALYETLVERAIPEGDGRLRLTDLANQVDEIADEPQVLVFEASALAGLARLTSERSAERCAMGRRLLALGGDRIPHDARAEALFRIELSAARHTESGAALRALEAARVLGRRPETALALLCHGLALLNGDAGREGVSRGLEVLTEAAGEARRISAGRVRSAIEMAVAAAHATHRGSVDPVRVEIHLRRAAESVDGAVETRGVGRLDPLLPVDARLELEAAVRGLLDADNTGLARRLCAAIRRQTGHFAPLLLNRSEHADRIRRAIRERFRLQWLDGASVPDEAPLWGGLEDAVPPRWSPRPSRKGEARCEFLVFETWAVCFVEREGTLHAQQYALTESALRELVQGLEDALEDGDEAGVSVFGGDLYRALIAPIEAHLDDVRTLIVAPHGPLVDLPFAAIGVGTLLVERFAIATAHPSVPGLYEADAGLAPNSVVIMGDGATTEDLRIAPVEGRNAVDSIVYRHGEALEPGQLGSTTQNGRFVHLVGGYSDGTGVRLRDDGQTTSALDLAVACGGGGALCLSSTHPIRASESRERLGLSLAGVRGGMLSCAWPITVGNEFMHGFFSRAAHASRRGALVNALADTQRAFIANDAPVWQWAAFRLFVPEIE